MATWIRTGTVPALLTALAAVAVPAAAIPRAVDPPGVASWPLWLPDPGTPPRPTSTGPSLLVEPADRRRAGRCGVERPSLHWTRTALDLIVKYRLNPLRASRVLALLHVGIHDALARAMRTKADERAAWIAVDRAASLCLADLFPQEPPERFEALGLGAAVGRGGSDDDLRAMWALGSDVAAAVAARARGDGADRVWPVDRRPPPAPGRWSPTPPINAYNPLEPLAGEWRTWVLPDGSAVEPPPPVPYDSPRFREEVDEVRRVAASLTPAQKAVAEAWNLDLGTVTPAGVWNLKAMELAEAGGLSGAETVRLHAALNVAMMDAFIACWHAKYEWWTVRPITVIRERYDPEFLSHLLTPAFPSYVSGHASASGAAEVVLARVFPGRADWLRDQAEEAAQSRLLGGIHYRSDNDEGLALGREVGRRVVERVFEGAGPPAPSRAAVAGPAIATPSNRRDAPPCGEAHVEEPQGLTTVNEATPLLRWAPLAGALTYRVEIESRIPEGRVLVSLDTLVAGTSFRPPRPLTAFRAAVKVRVSAGCPKDDGSALREKGAAFRIDTSPLCSFAQPLSVSPDRRWLQWNALPAALEYQVVLRDPGGEPRGEGNTEALRWALPASDRPLLAIVRPRCPSGFGLPSAALIGP